MLDRLLCSARLGRKTRPSDLSTQKLHICFQTEYENKAKLRHNSTEIVVMSMLSKNWLRIGF